MRALAPQVVVTLLILGLGGCGLPVLVVPDGPGPVGDQGSDGRADGAGEDALTGDLLADEGPPADRGLDGSTSCTTLQLKVTSAEDIGEIDGEAWLPLGEPDNDRLHMGWWMGDTTWSYFRFALPMELPAGTRIASAVVDLLGSEEVDWDSGVQALLVHAEEDADPQPILQAEVRPDSGQTIARPVTDPVRWPAQGGLAWLIGGYNTSPDLSTLLQSVLEASSGLAKGAHLQLWVTGERYEGSGEVTTPLLSDSMGMQPRLTLEVCSRSP